MENSSLDEVGEYNEITSPENVEDEEVSKRVLQKGKSKGKKRRSRRSAWDKNAVEVLVDIIINNKVFKKKPLVTNVKNVTNSRYYGQVIQKLMELCDAHGDEDNINVSQTQEKFKRCVEECRKAALTVKTALRIKRFQEK